MIRKIDYMKSCSYVCFSLLRPALASRRRDRQASSENSGQELIINCNRLNKARTRHGSRPSFRQPGPGSQAGFSLLECLLSLSLGLLVLISALEVFSQSRRVFNRLKETQESSLAAAVAIEKVREDLETAGAGLPVRIFDPDFKALEASGDSLIIFSKDAFIKLESEASAGQDFLQVELTPGQSSGLRKGRALYITDRTRGQLAWITAVLQNRLSISPALRDSYNASQTELYLLSKIEIYLDSDQKILRRKVNDTSGQPLMEEANSFESSYDSEKNLAKVSLSTDSGGKGYEYYLALYPKNLGKT
jgi:type II secretory pathway pseudopilin PulG